MYTVARVWYDASSIWQAMLFGVGALCVGYVVASLLDIPLRWQVRFVGWSLGVLSLLYCLGVLLQGQLVGLFALFGSGSNAFGVVAVLVTLYSLGQWVMRGWARMGADGRGWARMVPVHQEKSVARARSLVAYHITFFSQSAPVLWLVGACHCDSARVLFRARDAWATVTGSAQ
ncbi:MAG TPA: hypothetical protein VHZ51_21105 [Ktedonobacteraceae bacterium]|nr:hypothetical protein [Ktedonobacteraceae bacterium]